MKKIGLSLGRGRAKKKNKRWGCRMTQGKCRGRIGQILHQGRKMAKGKGGNL